LTISVSKDTQNETKSAIKIQCCSDLHLEFYTEMPNLITPAAPYLALLGDIGVPAKEGYEKFLLQEAEKYEKVFVIAGNHEFYHEIQSVTLDKIQRICSQHPNLVFMNRTSS
jgi:hypothetical protein